MKNGVKILDETDRQIAKMICAGETIPEIAESMRRSKQFIQKRIYPWIK